MAEGRTLATASNHQNIAMKTTPRRAGKKPKQFRFKPRKNIDGPGGCNNGERAERGDQAVEHYLYKLLKARAKDEIEDCNIQDLISDLGHYCDKEGYDFLEVVEMAQSNWRDER